MGVWGGVKGATDKHFRKGKIHCNEVHASESILNGKTPAARKVPWKQNRSLDVEIKGSKF